jgi:hypothetical protein
MPRTPERKELAARVWSWLDDGVSYREVAQRIGVKSLAMVARLRDEHRKSEMTDEVRESELADLAAWQGMLTEAAELILSGGEKVEKMAELATARAKISRERRMILGIDKPVRSQLDLRTNGEELPEPMMPQWLREFQESELARRLEGEANS